MKSEQDRFACSLVRITIGAIGVRDGCAWIGVGVCDAVVAFCF